MADAAFAGGSPERLGSAAGGERRTDGVGTRVPGVLVVWVRTDLKWGFMLLAWGSRGLWWAPARWGRWVGTGKRLGREQAGRGGGCGLGPSCSEDGE